jgi:hypothetical protein
MSRARGQDEPTGMQPDTRRHFQERDAPENTGCVVYLGEPGSQVNGSQKTSACSMGTWAVQNGFTTTRITIAIMRTVGTSLTMR